jgi:MFS family permease
MIFSVLKNKIFRNFFISDLISCFGVGMSTIGASWYALMETGSNKTVGILLAVNVVAGFLVSPVSGIIADKFNRKIIILWSFLIRALFLLILVILFVKQGFNIYYLYFFSAINGIGWVIYMATSRGFLQEILNKESLVNGNSLVEISLQIGMFLSAALSGFIYKYFNFNIILLINCIVFIVASFFIMNVKYIPTKVFLNANTKYFSMLKEGISYLGKEKLVLIIGLLSIVPLICTMLFNVVLPSYVNQTLNQDSVVFGFSDMFYGVGGAIAGLVISFIAFKIKHTYCALFFFFIATVNLVLLSVNQYVWGLYLGCLILGLSNSSLRVVINTIIMELVDNKYMGRVTSVWIGISLFSQAILSLVIAGVIDTKGASIGFMIMSTIMFLGLLGFVFIHKNVEKKS